MPKKKLRDCTLDEIRFLCRHYMCADCPLGCPIPCYPGCYSCKLGDHRISLLNRCWLDQEIDISEEEVK